MNNFLINVENVDAKYKSQENKTLSNINIKINKGEYIAILGRNGSGKSTFAKLLNALLLPDVGTVYVNGASTNRSDGLWDVRSSVGMVFQNPENQIIGTSVEDEVAFGPENLGIPSEQIINRVKDALNVVKMSEYVKSSINSLSGGQKQKIAIAGILAMKPECIIFDEATSMLDPVMRKGILDSLKKLNEDEKITIIHITNNSEEAVLAKRILVIHNGEIVLDGIPAQVFSDVEKIKQLGITVPLICELLYELRCEIYCYRGRYKCENNTNSENNYKYGESSFIHVGVFDADRAFEVINRFLIQVGNNSN